MLRVILLDDERPALKVLSKLIEEHHAVQVVGTYTDPLEMFNEVSRLMPDLVFLDIEMPEMNGLQMAARLRELREDIEIIFVTAYPQYALDAFRVSAIDYLVKPVEPDMLHRTLERVLKRKGTSTPPAAIETEPRIVCFGGFEIYEGEQTEPVRFPTVKADELFAYFLIHRNTMISKWTLCDSLWPEVASTDKVEHKLHVNMHRMKKTLRDSGIKVRMSSQKGFYRMDCDEICDYVLFEQAVTNMADVKKETTEALTTAFDLYKGPLFANRDYAWCEAERERMSRYFAGLAKEIAKRHLENDQHRQSAEVLLTLLSHVPLDEEAHELLLRTYKILQDRTAFLFHYEKMEKAFMEELGAEPPEFLKQMHADIYS